MERLYLVIMVLEGFPGRLVCELGHFGCHDVTSFWFGFQSLQFHVSRKLGFEFEVLNSKKI
jgi:hypothetical protein